MSATAQRAQKPYLRGQAVAERFGWSLNYVQELARRHELPHRVVPGTRTVLFPLEWLEAWEDGAELELIDLGRGGRLVRPKTSADPSLETREPGPLPGSKDSRESSDGNESSAG